MQQKRQLVQKDTNNLLIIKTQNIKRDNNNCKVNERNRLNYQYCA